jgi:hypothetical protein
VRGASSDFAAATAVFERRFDFWGFDNNDGEIE